MRKYILIIIFLLGYANLFCQGTTKVIYVADGSNFPNPGRGFYHAVSYIDPETIASFPEEGISLVFREYHLDPYKDQKIPVGFLWNLQRDFNALRQAGMKVVLRFRYTDKTTKPYGDAPLDIVLMHIEQLAPLLQKNKDVIYTFQAGFIGAWGEWYYTDYFSVAPGNISEENWNDRRSVVNALLAAVPPEIQINVRTPCYKKKLLEADEYIPVTLSEAYKNLPVARISHHNDCFLANYTDMGTYQDTAVEKPYLAQDTKYTVMGGETCSPSGYSHCDNAVKELKRFHWSYLNRDYHQSVIASWIEEGCYPFIQTHLGYRYRLIEGDFTPQTNTGGTFYFNLKLINEGFANPVNPVKAEIILKNTLTEKEYSAIIDQDIRKWPLNDTINLDLTFGIPTSMPIGTYKIFLDISDVNKTLDKNPSYHIRTANINTWDSVAGYNDLQETVEISDGSGSFYNGQDFFREKEMTVNDGLYSLNVDGVCDDWNKIPLLYQNTQQRVSQLKVWNSADSLYLMMAGDTVASCFTVDLFPNYTEEDTSFYPYFSIDCQGVSFYSSAGQQEPVETQPFYVNTNHCFELAVSLKDLSEHSALGKKFRVKATNFDEELTLVSIPENDGWITVTRNDLHYNPVVKAESKGNANMIFWNRNIYDDDGVINLYRDSLLVAVLPGDKVSYSDLDLPVSKTFNYSVCYVSSNGISQRDSVIVTTGEQQPIYLNISLDGSRDDWTLCPPVATNNDFLNGFTGVRFFNNNDSLFISINTEDSLKDYALYFYRKDEAGYDFLLKNDSLFKSENDGLSFVKILNSFYENNFMETGLRLSDINMDTIDYIKSKALVNGMDVWGNNQTFDYLKYETLKPPVDFGLRSSVDHPYSRIKVKWLLDKSPDGYVIERSVDDTLHFETLVRLNNHAAYYLDDEVDSSHVYYYRMFSYKNIIRSPYTAIEKMRPGFTGINTLRGNQCSLNLYPNPSQNKVSLALNLLAADEVTISIYSLTGVKMKNLFNGFVKEKVNLNFNVKGFPSGLYIIEVRGRKTNLIKKMMVQ